MSGWTKKQVHGWRKKRIATGYIALAFVLLILSSVYLLRRNNVKMVVLRDEVVAADKSGKNLPEAIENLNAHIFDHMNTTTVRPVELVYTYNREAQARIEAANKKKGKDVYQTAAKACERQGVPLTSIAQCAAQYAIKNGTNVGPQKITLPDKSLFIYSFASPRWTPDLAGLSVLLTGVLFIWLFVRLCEFLLTRLLMRRRLRNKF